MKKHEVWLKNKKLLIVGVDEQYEWRYRFDGSTYYISGLTLYKLISDGWSRLI